MSALKDQLLSAFETTLDGVSSMHGRALAARAFDGQDPIKTEAMDFISDPLAYSAISNQKLPRDPETLLHFKGDPVPRLWRPVLRTRCLELLARL